MTLKNAAGKSVTIDMSGTMPDEEAINSAARELGQSSGMLEVIGNQTNGRTFKGGRAIEAESRKDPTSAPAGFPKQGAILPAGKAITKSGTSGITEGEHVRYIGTSPDNPSIHVIENEEGEKIHLSPEDAAAVFSSQAEGPTASTEESSKDTGPAKLPKDLAGAKPKYKTVGLNFGSDVDRAAYITAQSKLSSRDADFLKFVMEATGMSEEEVRTYGKEIRSEIKKRESEAFDGYINVPDMARLRKSRARSAIR
jgi:hypothetical protein